MTEVTTALADEVIRLQWELREREATIALQTEAYAQLREELMRCGLLAVSERADGCIAKRTALRIREIAHRVCWPDEAGPVPSPVNDRDDLGPYPAPCDTCGAEIGEPCADCCEENYGTYWSVETTEDET